MNQPDMIGEPIRKAATLSDCGDYRYTLTRDWDEGSGTVCWLMLNPSTADAYTDDPTIRRCIHFSKFWGARGLVVVNLYPRRSSMPAICRTWRETTRWDPDAMEAYVENEAIVIEQVGKSDKVIAAWGSQPWAKDDAHLMLQTIWEETGETIYCIGTTTDGSPKHPMARGQHRVPDTQIPLIYTNGGQP